MVSPDAAAVPTPRIVFEDAHLVVLVKPAGLLSQGDISGTPSLVDWLRTYFGRHYVGLVHRLDRNTSGLMVAAKRSKSADRLTQSLQKGELKRHYLAWLRGALPGDAEWTHWLTKDEKANRTRVSPDPRPGAKEAKLRVEAVERTHLGQQIITLARFTLETGRSHQIRAQAAYAGFPVLGDAKYVSSADSSAPGREFSRPALHSAELKFPHPMSGEILRYREALPPDMERLRRKPHAL